MAQVQLGLLNGYNTVLVFSLTSGDITLTFADGAVLTETPAAYGDDDGHGVVGYKATFDLTGRWSDFGRKPYTATQGAKSRSGTYTTLPGETDKFRKAFQTCDSPGANTGAGFWSYLRGFADDPIPMAGVTFADDFCYASAQAVTSTEDSVSLTSAPFTTARMHDYCIVYTAALGLYADTATGNVASFGHNEDRQYCYANFNIWPQWGDWEFANDIGVARATQDNVTGSPTNQAIFQAGKAAYDVFLKPLQPPAIDGANSNAWGFALGPMYICAPDYITNADWSNATPVVYGATQLASIKTALNNDSPIKDLVLGHGVRYLVDPSTAILTGGAQHPLFDMALGEYQSLMTATGLTPPSLMDNPKTNGLRGTLWTEHGDYHRMKVEHHQKAAYSGNAAENFWSFTQGGNNGGAAPFSVVAQIATDYAAGTLMPSGGADTGLTELVYLSSSEVGSSIPKRHKAGQITTVYGDQWPIEVHIEMRAAPTDAEVGTNDNQTVWSGKFIHRYGGNDAHDVDVEIAPMAMMADGGDFT